MTSRLNTQPQYGPGDYIPLMVVTYWTFRIMMTFGFVMIGLAAFFLWSTCAGDIDQTPSG